MSKYFEKANSKNSNGISSFEMQRRISKSLDLSRAIRAGLKNKGWNQKKLASQIGTEAEVSKWLSGYHNFTWSTILRLENILDITLVEVTNLNDSSKPVNARGLIELTGLIDTRNDKKYTFYEEYQFSLNTVSNLMVCEPILNYKSNIKLSEKKIRHLGKNKSKVKNCNV